MNVLRLKKKNKTCFGNGEGLGPFSYSTLLCFVLKIHVGTYDLLALLDGSLKKKNECFHNYFFIFLDFL